MADKMQAVSNMNTRQKITAGVFGVIILVVLWQVWGMFGGKSSKPTHTASNQTMMQPNMSSLPAPSVPTQMQQVPQQTANTPQEQASMQQQQDAQLRYLQALNELQLLKVSQNIAETNRSIMAAKFDTINSEKKIVDLLSGPAQPAPNYAQAMTNNVSNESATTKTVTTTSEVPYNVVSITETHEVWSAVLGSSGTLYHVRVGDVLPADGSTVISIHANSVTIEKAGARRKLSLVSII
jgi:type IV pilus biogenesis protein PilP